MQQVELVEEKTLQNRSEVVKAQALQVRVIDKESFDLATEFCKQIKDAQKAVTEYWATPKKSAYDSWKSITAKENEMLKPLQESEKALKRELADYVRIQEDEKRKAEEEARKETGLDIVLEADIPTTKGVSYIDDYIVTVEDITKVPTSLNGSQIVYVDLGLVKKMVQMSKGLLVIPGIKVEKTKRVSMR